MARPKRKVNPILPVAAPAEATKKLYQAGGYVRLSVEDSGSMTSTATTDGRGRTSTARNLSG